MFQIFYKNAQKKGLLLLPNQGHPNRVVDPKIASTCCADKDVEKKDSFLCFI